MAAETLKEFLVAVNWQGDEDREKKMTASLQAATLNANLLGAAVEGIAEMVAENIGPVAKTFEDLYFQAARVHATAENIVSFEYAISRGGGTIEGARELIEKFAELERQNPAGWEKYINDLGVDTRNANGLLRQSTDVLADLGKVIGKMPVGTQEQYMKMFGFTRENIDAINSEEFQIKREERRRSIKAAHMPGESEEQDAADAHRFEESWNKTWGILGDLGDAAALRIMRRVQPVLDKAADKLAAHERDIANLSSGVRTGGLQNLGPLGGLAALLYTHRDALGGLFGAASAASPTGGPTSLMINGAPVSPANSLPTQEQGGFWSGVGSFFSGVPAAVRQTLGLPGQESLLRSSMPQGASPPAGAAKFTSSGAGTGQSLFSGAETPDQIVTKLQTMRDNGEITSEQCIALANAARGKPNENVTNWRPGASLATSDPAPGTAFATFENGRYAEGGTGTPGINRDHAFVTLSAVKRDAAGKPISVDVAEQYAGSGGIRRRTYYFGQGWGEQDPANYSAITDERDQPRVLAAGTHEALAGSAGGGNVGETAGAGFVPLPAGTVAHPDYQAVAADLAAWRPQTPTAASPDTGPYGQIDNSMKTNNVSQAITIHVDGSTDPQTTAAMIGMHIQRTNDDWTRAMQ